MNSLTTLRYSECDIDDKMKASMVFRVCPRFVWGTNRHHTNQLYNLLSESVNDWVATCAKSTYLWWRWWWRI